MSAQDDPAAGSDRRLFRVLLTYSVEVEVEADTEAEAVDKAHHNAFCAKTWETLDEVVEDLGKVCEDPLPYEVERTPCGKAALALRRMINKAEMSQEDWEAIGRLPSWLDALESKAKQARDVVGYDSGNWTDDEASGRHWGFGSVFRCWGDWITDDLKQQPDGSMLVGAGDAVESVLEALDASEGLLNHIDGFTGVDDLPPQQGGPPIV